MAVNVNVTVESNIFEALHDAESRLNHGLDLAAERLLALAIPLTPKDVGTLRDSGDVVRATDPEEGSAVTFGTVYAPRLHEHPEYSFTEPGTGGKYLERPALDNKDELGAIIGKSVRNG